jgi:hypothetical protein
MSAVLRLCLAYGTAVPIQRWLGAIALLALPLGATALLLGRPDFVVLSLVAIASYLLATSLLTGYLFRELSVPRTHRFLPHYRGRMLTAFLIVLLIVSTPSLLLLALPGALQWPGAVLLLVTNGCVLFTFLPSLFMAGSLSALAVLLGARSGLAVGVLGASPRVLVVAVWLAVWLALSIWYLRARELRKFSTLFGFGRLDPRLFADVSGAFSRAAAIRTSFTAGYPLRAKHRLLRLAMLAAVAFSAGALLRLIARVNLTPGTMTLALTAGIFAPTGADRWARRARLLWLQSGESRRALFARVERLLWTESLPLAAAGFLGLAATIGPAELRTDLLGRAALILVTTAAFGFYLGLLLLSPLRGVVAAIPLMATFAVGVGAVLSAPHGGWVAAVAAAQAGAALTTRALAVRRWRRADWLSYRPLRLPHQSVRTGR